MENLSTLRGCIDDAIASLEGLGTDEEGDSIRQAQSRLKKAMEITTALSSSLGSHRIQLEGASDEHADIARYLKGAAITGIAGAFNTGFPIQRFHFQTCILTKAIHTGHFMDRLGLGSCVLLQCIKWLGNINVDTCFLQGQYLHFTAQYRPDLLYFEQVIGSKDQFHAVKY